jgi:hypothetical protein
MASVSDSFDRKNKVQHNFTLYFVLTPKHFFIRPSFNMAALTACPKIAFPWGVTWTISSK